MSIAGLADLVLTNPTLRAAMADAGSVPTLDLTGPAALRPFVVKGLVDAGRTVLAVAATARDAEDLVETLGDVINPDLVGYYPAWETLPHERLSPRSDTVGRRLAVLRRIRHPGSDPGNGPLHVVVAPIRAVLQPQVRGLADLAPVELTVGDGAELDDVVRRLAEAAYSRVDLVERRGEFAVRGGIVDVFPPTEEHPLRVEFFGDEIDEIRSFAVADQRTMDPVLRLWAPPCRELLLDAGVRRRAKALGEAHPELRDLTDRMAEGIAVEGMEALSPVLVEEMELLVDLMPSDTHVLLLDPERVRTRAHDLVATSEDFLGASWAAAAGGGEAPIDLGAASLRELGDVRAAVLGQGKSWWSVSPFGLGEAAPDSGVSTSLAALAARPPVSVVEQGALAPDSGVSTSLAALAARPPGAGADRPPVSVVEQGALAPDSGVSTSLAALAARPPGAGAAGPPGAGAARPPVSVVGQGALAPDVETPGTTTEAGAVEAPEAAGGVDSRVVAVTAAREYRGDVERAIADVRGWLADGQRVVLLSEGHGPAQRMAEVLADHDVPARLVDDLRSEPERDLVTVACAVLPNGLLDPAVGLVVLTREDVLGQRASTRDMRKMPVRRKKQIDPLELKSGDYVVHEQHGVGRFVEMRQREFQGAVREYLVLEYGSGKRGGPPDRLFVPADTLDQVTRYVGGEQPSLDRLGGGDWARRKGRARKAVRQIAAELIKLYAARQATKGHRFGPDTPWQRELEDAFPFHETPDQLSTVEDVKRDMERTVPMDRLVCGDVGYGKTEIAVRAVFKAVQDGKQAVVLVPTTLLVQQHFATFEERMSGFPVTLRALSRFQSDKEAEEVVAGLADGSVDIVIGTHRLLNPDVRVKDLGLIVVDEEQRFGVEHKEQMKRLRTSVDVLSMSATPIPRTLEMAITGIREMSTITTPPEERHPVLTYVGGYEDRQVTAAVRRELLRDGQVFFIHNRVNTIEKAAAHLKRLVPEARIATAHGQLGEHRLEQVMLDFWEKRFDVLVCTTIVESGLDVSNANTMIIERADTLGLSQLHQLRGRVGRSRERAYGYFLYPPEKPLTETAHERLATLAQHSDLGGGMAIAMKDLEIRGAGNLLGGEQSGHIADVGFDLYVRLVGEAVSEFRQDGGQPEQVQEVRIEVPVDAHLPHDYIGSERLRLEMYKRLSEVRSDDDVALLREELVDRYGEPPPEVARLLAVASFRARARRAGLSEITAQGKYVRFAPVDLPDSAVVRLQRLYPKSVVKTTVRTMLVPRPLSPTFRDEELLGWTRKVIDTVLSGTASPLPSTS